MMMERQRDYPASPKALAIMMEPAWRIYDTSYLHIPFIFLKFREFLPAARITDYLKST